MTTTTQEAFHPMLGHIFDGCQIKMRDGSVLVLRAVMQGWQLRDSRGRPYGTPSASAHVVADLVNKYPQETANAA